MFVERIADFFILIFRSYYFKLFWFLEAPKTWLLQIFIIKERWRIAISICFFALCVFYFCFALFCFCFFVFIFGFFFLQSWLKHSFDSFNENIILSYYFYFFFLFFSFFFSLCFVIFARFETLKFLKLRLES